MFKLDDTFGGTTRAFQVPGFLVFPIIRQAGHAWIGGRQYDRLREVTTLSLTRLENACKTHLELCQISWGIRTWSSYGLREVVMVHAEENLSRNEERH
jgi:hypothetical protein